MHREHGVALSEKGEQFLSQDKWNIQKDREVDVGPRNCKGMLQRPVLAMSLETQHRQGWGRALGSLAGPSPVWAQHLRANALPDSLARLSALQTTVRLANSTCPISYLLLPFQQPRKFASKTRIQLVLWMQDFNCRLGFSQWHATPTCTCAWELTVGLSAQLCGIR